MEVESVMVAIYVVAALAHVNKAKPTDGETFALLLTTDARSAEAPADPLPAAGLELGKGDNPAGH